MDIVITKYKKTGKGITYTDLLNKGLVRSKRQAQDTIKYQLRRGNLFTTRVKRPQEYFATKIKAEVLAKVLAGNTLKDPMGVGAVTDYFRSKSALSSCIQYQAFQTFEDFVLPLLPEAPLEIHNMHLKTHVPSTCFAELKLPSYTRNGGKHWEEIIGEARVKYTLYGCGTVDMQASCARNPFRLETKTDLARLLVFLGQIRGRLIGFLCDPHERFVEDVMEWYLTECDLNRDVKLSDALHISALGIQVKHASHVFSIYIKAIGKDTYCRFEERMHFRNKTVIEAINEVFNPNEKIEKQIAELSHKMDQLIGGNRPLSWS